MSRFTGASLAVAGAMLLTACGGFEPQAAQITDTPTLASPSAEKTEPAPTTPAGPSRNARGNIVKALGEEGGISSTTSGTAVPIVTFAIDAIAPVECTKPYSSYEPENGNIVALTMRVSTAPELGSEYFSVSNAEFSFIGTDGITMTNVSTIATYACLPDGELLTSDQMMPGSQYAGKVLLDLPATTGTVVYRPSGISNGGWEWPF